MNSTAHKELTGASPSMGEQNRSVGSQLESRSQPEAAPVPARGYEITDAIQADADRYHWLLKNPDIARNLLHLLERGKGTAADFTKMIDRIRASAAAAGAKCA